MLDNVHTNPVRHASLEQWGKVHQSFFRPIASPAKDLKSPLAISRRSRCRIIIYKKGLSLETDIVIKPPSDLGGLK